jgi:four helix bundle protein
MPERDFRESIVWKKSRYLMLALFNATETFPARDAQGMTNQIRHDCLAMATNIAKGYGKLVNGEVADFFRRAWQAAGDLERHLLSACCHGLLNQSSYERFAHEVITIKGLLAAQIK